ncbi:hypothetical protein ACVWXO_001576 [Bradyrhizobium sp. LM2.7]
MSPTPTITEKPCAEGQSHIPWRRNRLALDCHGGIGEVTDRNQHSREEDKKEHTHGAFSGCAVSQRLQVVGTVPEFRAAIPPERPLAQAQALQTIGQAL